MTISTAFCNELRGLEFKDVFNPYRDRCPEHDLADAPAIRRKNLRLVLDAACAAGIDIMWFGRDLGYRGGRRTGLALTDEVNLPKLKKAYGGIALRQATATNAVGELTAKQIWKVIEHLPAPPFLWNVFPFHPHEHGNSMSNRPHTRTEVQLCEALLDMLLRIINPVRIIALGQAAHSALSRHGRSCTIIRHPSYGGQTQFRDGVERFYKIKLRSMISARS